MRSITTRFILLIATAAVAPLVIYGAVSVGQLRAGIENSVEEGNMRVAEQVATQISLYIETNARILRSVGEELNGTRLAAWQQSRILRNHVLDFREFREITLFDASGRPVVTSRVGAPSTAVPESPGRETHGVQVFRIFEDEDNLPATELALRLGAASERGGWLVARVSLEELWRFVDRVRVGTEGYALVLSDEQRLVAHGDPRQKRLVAISSESQKDVPSVRLLSEIDPALPTFAGRYRDGDEREKLVTGARVPDLNWTVMVEQPTDEAFALTTEMGGQLLASITIALLATAVVGWVWTRSFVNRIYALTRATRAIADGRLDERVSIRGRDEIRQLGEAFNAMADRLVELQENVRKQERQAMFGKIAAGLVHDLWTPVQTIENNSKLIVKLFDDPSYRETFRQIIDRETGIVRRILDDLKNIARPIPLERFPVEVNRSLTDAVQSMQQQADAAGVVLRSELSVEPAFIEGDLFALGRVYRNLILNAIQATAPGGLVVVRSETRGEAVRIHVDDTGCGIPAERLPAIFEDFVTTKRRGLGLGLAISRKIVEQLGGRISVTSELGKGTTVTLEFARTRARPMLVAG